MNAKICIHVKSVACSSCCDWYFDAGFKFNHAIGYFVGKDAVDLGDFQCVKTHMSTNEPWSIKYDSHVKLNICTIFNLKCIETPGELSILFPKSWPILSRTRDTICMLQILNNIQHNFVSMQSVICTVRQLSASMCKGLYFLAYKAVCGNIASFYWIQPV